MTSIEEVKELENKMVESELGPDANFFETYIADNALLDGQFLKQKVVDAHQPGKGSKFTSVEMSNFQFYDHGSTVVVTCTGKYISAAWSGTLNFVRVWHKQNNSWKIIAGTTAKP